MDHNYRPQSPDLSSYAPKSPDLSGFHAQSPDLPAVGTPHYSNFDQGSYNHGNQGQSQVGRFQAFSGAHGFGGPMNHQPTSVPQLPPYGFNRYQLYEQPPMTAQHFLQQQDVDPEFLPDKQGPNKRPRRMKKESDFMMGGHQGSFASNPQIKTEEFDPTLGCQLKTSFPVARIKRLMQADEDIGKVAQVTPTVVSRALELFMIKLISASADQARGGAGAAGSGKGPKRILVQHLKKAVLATETFDFLNEIVSKVPDAPSKAAKKENGSDSEDANKPKKRGKRRKDSGDDF